MLGAWRCAVATPVAVLLLAAAALTPSRGAAQAQDAASASALEEQAGVPSAEPGEEPGEELAEGPVDEQDVAESTRELERLRGQIRDHRARVSSLTDRERDAAAHLEDIETEIKLVRRLLRNLDARERILQQRSDTLRTELRRHQAAFDARRSEAAARLRALYVQGPRSELETVLLARSYTALVARLKYATTMARLDRQLLERTRQQGLAVMQQEQQLREAMAGVWEAREEARNESVRLVDIEAERRSSLLGVRQQKRAAQSSLAELEANAGRLTDLLAQLEQRRVGYRGPAEASPPDAAGGFAAMAGWLEWPVAGGLMRPFGRSVHPEFKTVTVHNGITIAAVLGAPIKAVAAGTVAFVDRLPGYGQCVILDHGQGYYSLYAHAASVAVARGATVARGQVVAQVGEPEGGDRPQLYFEIRQGRAPVDPQLWLRPQP